MAQAIGARISTLSWSAIRLVARITSLANKRGRPIHPDAPNRGAKTIYVKDWSRWDQFIDLANKRGQSVSELLSEAVDRMLAGENAAEYKITQIRRILDGDQ